MQKYKFTKDKFKAFIQVIDFIRGQLEKEKFHPKRFSLAVIKAHLYVLDKLSRKMRTKLPMLEDRTGNHIIRYEIDPIQILVLISHKDITVPDAPGMNPYSYSVFMEITQHIYQKQLS